MFGMNLITAKKYRFMWSLVLACGLVTCAANNSEDRSVGKSVRRGTARPGPAGAGDRVWRLDCGTERSPVMQGYRRLTADRQYEASQGYGWRGGQPVHLVFRKPTPNPKLRGSFSEQLLTEPYDKHRNPLNLDGVMSRRDIGFRLDVPDGVYRVSITMGSLTAAIGSIDLFVNDKMVAEQLAVWSPGGYRMLEKTPAGWWTTFRSTVKVTNGAIQIDWKKNQQHYDTELAEQATWETPYARWYHATPIVQKPPYNFIGYPFVGHSIMAIDVTP